tara:strand:- start:1661 stop:1897 length:237 start_codon:yes stop_codon:yes gene_type:complete
MSKGQQRRLNDLEEIIAHLHTEVELKDYWIETFTSENQYAQSVKDWHSQQDEIAKHVNNMAKSLGKIMDLVEDEPDAA